MKTKRHLYPDVGLVLAAVICLLAVNKKTKKLRDASEEDNKKMIKTDPKDK